MNPLKSLMGGGGNNPLMNMIGGNNPLLGMLSSGGNPQQMLMNMLKQNNPQAYQQIEHMMKSGMNPQQAMQQMGISQDQIAQVKNQAQGFFGNNAK